MKSDSPKKSRQSNRVKKNNSSDGDTDEELLITVYPDGDGDGFGRTEDEVSGCDGVSGYVEADGDCNDSNPAIHPDADELCDDIDNNCNDIIDDIPEDTVFTYYVDDDGDGYGADGSSTGMSACLPPDGFVTIDGDCDDTAYAINPDADELCDDEDNDCDDSIDEDAIDAPTWYADEDGDGIGDPTTSIVACSAEDDWVMEIGCPVDWTIMGDGERCVRVFADTTITWHEAQSACLDLGGSLVTIRSAADNTQVYELSGGLTAIYTWIGWNRLGAGGSWRWVSGAQRMLSFWGARSITPG